MRSRRSPQSVPLARITTPSAHHRWAPASPTTSTCFSNLPTGLLIPHRSQLSLSNEFPESEKAASQNVHPEEPPLQPVMFKWEGNGGQRISLAGAFLQGWRDRQPLTYDPSTNLHTLTLLLPPGTHRFKFVTDDGIWRCSASYATASDGDGNLINHITVTPATRMFPHAPASFTSAAPPATAPVETFDSSVLDGLWDGNTRSDFSSDSLSAVWVSKPPKLLSPLFPGYPPPPVLPPHLEKVILNAVRRHGLDEGQDTSVLPLAKTVVLNHLATRALRDDVLTVAVTARYGSKLLTTIYYRDAGEVQVDRLPVSRPNVGSPSQRSFHHRRGHA